MSYIQWVLLQIPKSSRQLSGDDLKINMKFLHYRQFKKNFEKIAFNLLKKSLTTAPIVVYPKGEKLFIIVKDASQTSISAVLSEVQNGEKVVIIYFS